MMRGKSSFRAKEAPLNHNRKFRSQKFVLSKNLWAIESLENIIDQIESFHFLLYREIKLSFGTLGTNFEEPNQAIEF